MRSISIALMIFGLIPQVLLAQTTLYACTIKGQTTLESTHEDGCDTLVVYHYPTYDKHPQHVNSNLRPEEIRQLRASEGTLYSQESQIRHYENVDDRIGWVAVHDYFDSRGDKCAAYQRQLNNALLYIDAKNEMMIDIGPFRAAELTAQILQAKPQVDYYCH
jgi:hypothetical protein